MSFYVKIFLLYSLDHTEKNKYKNYKLSARVTRFYPKSWSCDQKMTLKKKKIEIQSKTKLNYVPFKFQLFRQTQGYVKVPLCYMQRAKARQGRVESPPCGRDMSQIRRVQQLGLILKTRCHCNRIVRALCCWCCEWEYVSEAFVYFGKWDRHKRI